MDAGLVQIRDQMSAAGAITGLQPVKVTGEGLPADPAIIKDRSACARLRIGTAPRRMGPIKVPFLRTPVREE